MRAGCRVFLPKLRGLTIPNPALRATLSRLLERVLNKGKIMAKKIYTVLNPVEHDQEHFKVGSPISLEDKDATPLLAVKAIELAVTQIPGAAAAPTDPAERLAAIKEAIGSLDKGNAALWTGTGMPKVPAIAAVTGWDITQPERDAVWAEINKV